MKHPVATPNLGLVDAITVISWTRASGDTVALDDVVVVIETEKAQVDVNAPAAGILEVLVEAGPELVPVDAVLGFIDDGA